MTRYVFECSDDECPNLTVVERPMSEGPPKSLTCSECGSPMVRVWSTPQLLLRGDPDDVGEANLLCDNGGRVITNGAAVAKEQAYRRHIEERRKVFKENKQVGGRMTHQVPTELYHAKVKQTGDKDYWKDPKNLERHKSCKVS